MTNICDLLREHIEKNGYTIYSFANRSKINRTTLQKTLSGDRTLTSEVLQQIINTLPITPHEYKELQTSFLIYSIGESRYRDRMFIKDFLEWHSSYLSYSSLIETGIAAQFSKHHPLLETDSRLLAGRMTLIQLLYVLLANASSDTPELCTYSVFNHEFFSEISNMIPHLTNKKVQLKHLFAVDKTTESKDGVFHNLKLLTNLIPYILQNFSTASTRYYYGNVEKYDPDGILFPFFIVVENAVILTTASFETSIYLTAEDIVLFYTKQFRQMYEVSLPFSKNISPSTNFLSYVVENFKPSDMTYCIEYQPCLLLLLDEDMAPRLLNPELEYRDIIISQLSLRQKHMSQQQGMFYFTRAGLDYFARNGIFQEVAPYCDSPISVKDRIRLLTKMIEQNQQGLHKYIMLNERELNPNPNFTLSIEDPNTIMIQIKHENGNTRFCEFHKNTLFQAFLDFFTSMDVHRFSLTIEETDIYLRQLIKELQAEAK